MSEHATRPDRGLLRDAPRVEVRPGQLEAALKKFKRLCSPVFGELKRRAHHAPPGERRRLKSKKARARAAKRLKRAAEFEALRESDK